ncbi:hypothetical protein F1880_005999 [Penicillium rolfsii]|nr:hypothetical protein F1880_005999 [Penicillium rolfsii]
MELVPYEPSVGEEGIDNRRTVTTAFVATQTAKKRRRWILLGREHKHLSNATRPADVTAQ